MNNEPATKESLPVAPANQAEATSAAVEPTDVPAESEPPPADANIITVKNDLRFRMLDLSI